MGSTRFPGKVLAPLARKPVLQHVIEKCEQIKVPLRYNKLIIVAVPDKPESESIGQLLIDLEIEHFCGDEDNVLQRYYHCAKFFNLDIIMRITADCPMLNPVVATEVLDLLIWRKCDYTSNIYPTRTYPKGLDCECFTFDCLEACYVKVMERYSINKSNKGIDILTNQPYCTMELYDMEHVTPWMQRTPEVKKALVSQLQNRSQQNLCVDHPEDIAKLEKILNKKPKLTVVK